MKILELPLFIKRLLGIEKQLTRIADMLQRDLEYRGISPHPPADSSEEITVDYTDEMMDLAHEIASQQNRKVKE